MLVNIGPKHWRVLAKPEQGNCCIPVTPRSIMQTLTVDRGFPGVSNRRFFSACAIFEPQAVSAPQPSCFQLDA